MKKLILSLFVVVAVAISAVAVEHKAPSLIKTSSNSGTLILADAATTNLPSTVYSDAPLWSNPDGSVANCALLVSLIGTNANQTNTFTLTLQTVPDGSLVTTTSTTNRVTVTLKATGTTRVTECTPIPTANLVGAKGLRLVTVATDSKSTPGVTTMTAKLVGFVP